MVFTRNHDKYLRPLYKINIHKIRFFFKPHGYITPLVLFHRLVGEIDIPELEIALADEQHIVKPIWVYYKLPHSLFQLLPQDFKPFHVIPNHEYLSSPFLIVAKCIGHVFFWFDLDHDDVVRLIEDMLQNSLGFRVMKAEDDQIGDVSNFLFHAEDFVDC